MRAEHTVQETTVVVTEALDGAAVERWRSRLAEAAALRPARLVVDLRRSPRIDAAAIVVLLQLHRDMMRTDGRLTLRGPVDRVRRMLGLARVDHVLEVEEAR
ncbi:STAS domain-containing protein [Winogradskya consettensis]|uniref:STAS domain-containing protein n=1 Tax=Winogradskya consettensis TaxID=113560 RepID=UPI001BB32121|nr:STAS domain-containing protein [Actinoplanes consettensis]